MAAGAPHSPLGDELSPEGWRLEPGRVKGLSSDTLDAFDVSTRRTVVSAVKIVADDFVHVATMNANSTHMGNPGRK